MAAKPRTTTQLNLFGPLRHIEIALTREYDLLTKTDRNKFGAQLRAIRENIRDLDTALADAQAKRSAKNANRK